MAHYIPQSFIQELVSRADIVELIQSRVVLKKTGVNFSACCPFHQEKTPSFTVSPQKQFYHCFGCGANGNVISFLMHYDQLEFLDAIESLAAQMGLVVPKELTANGSGENTQPLLNLLEEVTKFYQKKLKQSPEAIHYLKSRGLSGKTAQHFRLGYAPESWNLLSKHLGQETATQDQLIKVGMLINKEPGHVYDRFRHRIIFPIRNLQGRVIAFGGRDLGNDQSKYLNSPETVLFSKSQEIYGLYEAKKASRELKNLLVVEGYMDVLSLWQHGFFTAVATMGTAINAKHVQKLSRYTQRLIFCFDGDEAGKRAGWKALEVSLGMMREGLNIRFMFLPKGEDPDSLVRREGYEAFMQRLQEAKSLSDTFFEHLKQKIPLTSLEARVQYAKEAGHYLGQIPGGIFQQLMYQRLSELLNIGVEQLQKQMQDQIVSKEQKLPKTEVSRMASLSGKRLLNPFQTVVALLLQRPEFVNLVTDAELGEFSAVPEFHLLIDLVHILKNRPAVTLGALLEYWQNNEQKKWISELAAHKMLLLGEGLKDAFLGGLKRLREQVNDQKILELIDKSKKNGLSEEERTLLNQLLTKN